MAEETEVLDPRTLSSGPEGDKPYLTKSTTQLDAEDRERERENQDKPEARVTTVNAPYATEDTDTSAYFGVSAEYATHAGVQNQPFAADGGAEQAREERIQGAAAGTVSANPAHEGNATEGGGSTLETVYSHTAGDNATAEVVDREEVHGRSAKRKESEAKAEHRPPPRKTTAAAQASDDDKN